MKQKIIGILSLMAIILFAMSTTTLAGDFIIQNYTFAEIFSVDNATGNVNVTGELYENATAIKTTYWQIANAGTPADGSDDNVSTANQIYDFVTGQGYTGSAWNDLANITLTEAYILVGNSSNVPHGVAISGDATIVADGTLTLDADIMRDAEITDWDYWNESTDLSNYEINQSKVNFSITCNAGSHLYTASNELACETDDDTTYTADIPLNLTGTVFGLIDCADTEIYKFNATGLVWECEPDGGSGISNVVEDLTPQLGGNLDVNDFGIDGGGETNMTIDATGNFIIVLA